MAVKASLAPHRVIRGARNLRFPSRKQTEGAETKRRARRVLHISSSDCAGTAGRGALGLHQALRAAGEHSRMFVLNKESEGPAILRYHPEEDFLSRVGRMVRKAYLQRLQDACWGTRPNDWSDFSDDRSPHGPDLGDQLPIRDLVHLHSISNFIDLRKTFPLISGRPLVWTLHDMNPFTGGCHQSGGCDRYINTCGYCPQLGSTRGNDLSRKAHWRKQRAFESLNPARVRIVAVNSALAKAARRSSLLRDFNISHIPYGIDPEAFRPRDRRALRASLELPTTAFVVLVHLTDPCNSRSGILPVVEALQQLSTGADCVLLSAGDQPEPFDAPFRHVHLGSLTSDDMLSLFYSTGDCLVSASPRQAFELSALEAMSCGTPVVSFDLPGLADIMRSGQTGFLARSGDVTDLVQKIQRIKENPAEARAMGRNGRTLVRESYSVARETQSYLELYQELEQSLRFLPNAAPGSADEDEVEEEDG